MGVVVEHTCDICAKRVASGPPEIVLEKLQVPGSATSGEVKLVGVQLPDAGSKGVTFRRDVEVARWLVCGPGCLSNALIRANNELLAQSWSVPRTAFRIEVSFADGLVDLDGEDPA